MAKEKNLTAVTSVAAADFARVVTSAGASVKATFANVAKYIVETYNGSTVAGSAQSVKSALDSLNSNRMYRSGDSVTIARNYLAGYLSSNGKVSITVPLSKPIYDPTQATGSVTCSDISLFRVGGSQNVKSMVTSVVGYNRCNGVDVEITLSSVPSGFTWGNVTVDFRGTITF